MKDPSSRLRKRLIFVALPLIALAAAWLFYSRSVLFAPVQVPSRVPLDYECPFPLEADVSLPAYVPVELDGSPIGMPDEHWGEARVEFPAHVSESYYENEPPCVGPDEDEPEYSDPGCYRVVYHGDKITEIVERSDRTCAPWSHRYIRGYYSYHSRRGGGGFGGGDFGPGGFGGGSDDPLSGLEHRINSVRDTALCTAARLYGFGLMVKDAARWLCLSTVLPKRTLVSRRAYAYDADGRLVEKHLEDLRLDWRSRAGFSLGVFGGGGFSGDDVAPTTVTRRFLYDEAGHVVGHLIYGDSKLKEAEIIVVRGAWPSRDELSYRHSRGYLSGMTWRRYTGAGDWAWWAWYGANGRLDTDDTGMSGIAYFRDGDGEVVETVRFGPDGRLAADDEGEAVARYYRNKSGTWQATAHYGKDGRLLKRPDAIQVTRSDKSGNVRSEMTYSNRRTRTSHEPH